MNRSPAVVLISLAVAAQGAQAETWYVDATVSNPGDGRSWSGAFQFLQDALYEPDLAANDEIRVAAGTYLPDRYATAPYGTGDLTESFDLRPGVAVYGGFPPGGGWRRNSSVPSEPPRARRSDTGLRSISVRSWTHQLVFEEQ